MEPEAIKKHEETFRQACRGLALTWLGRGRASFADANHVELLADSLLGQVQDAAFSTIVDDPEVVVHAIKYFSVAHVYGPWGKFEPEHLAEQTAHVRWMLRALLELAAPNSGHPKESDAFFRDVEEGIATVREDWSQR